MNDQAPAPRATAPRATAPRAFCVPCQRPLRNCICDLVQAVEHASEVLILQHPLEVREAKGTARLLHLCLRRSRLEVGEQFASDVLQSWLTEDWHGNPAMSPRTVLLYPESAHDPALPLLPAPPLPPAWLESPQPLRLVVIDGTWRKSRKMLYLNPLLQQLPRLALRDMPASRYLIRKAHRPDQLSTLEATCAALMQLEGQVEPFAPLLAAFDGFVAQQLGYRLGSL